MVTWWHIHMLMHASSMVSVYWANDDDFVYSLKKATAATVVCDVKRTCNQRSIDSVEMLFVCHCYTCTLLFSVLYVSLSSTLILFILQAFYVFCTLFSTLLIHKNVYDFTGATGVKSQECMNLIKSTISNWKCINIWFYCYTLRNGFIQCSLAVDWFFEFRSTMYWFHRRGMGIRNAIFTFSFIFNFSILIE